jgi:hypothetical protein
VAGKRAKNSQVATSPVVRNHRLITGNPQSGLCRRSKQVLSKGEDEGKRWRKNRRLIIGNPQSGFGRRNIAGG